MSDEEGVVTGWGCNMRNICVLVAAGMTGLAMGGPVTFEFWDVGGEWGVFADDAMGGLNLPDQGMFNLSAGSIFEAWDQIDGIASAESSIMGDLFVQSDSEGALFAGDLDLSVLARVDGDGPGENELAIANLGLTSIFLNVQVLEPVTLTIEGRSVFEVLQGLGELGEGEHELLTGQYWFEVAGSGLFLDVTAGANQTVSDSANFAWSMGFAPVPSVPVLGVFGMAGGLVAGRRRR